jgi:PilZ domain
MDTATRTTFHVNKKNEITLICPRCGKVKKHRLAHPELAGKLLRITCSCGHAFVAVIDGRRHYRKRVRLEGKCCTAAAGGPFERITVENISHSGISFRTPWKNQCRVSDILRLSFVLDNAHRTEISKTVVVKHVQGCVVGAEYCQPDEPNATLGFYLMPI